MHRQFMSRITPRTGDDVVGRVERSGVPRSGNLAQAQAIGNDQERGWSERETDKGAPQEWNV